MLALKKNIPIIAILLLNLIGAGGYLWYYIQTNITAEIEICSKKKCVLILNTPLNSVIKIDVQPDETIKIPKRPLKSIYYNINGEPKLLELKESKQGFYRAEGIIIIIKDKDIKNLIDLFYFLIAMKYHYPLIIINLLLLIWLFYLKRDIIRKYIYKLKIIVFQFVIENKPSKEEILQYKINDIISRTVFRFLIIISLIYIVSLFIGLGNDNIDQISTERIRALTTLEMKLSGNYITPTVNGEYYYNKPPLFNYLLLPFVDSKYNLEFKLRSVTVFTIILLGILVFFIAKSQFDKKKSLFVTLLFLTSATLYLGYSKTLTLEPFFAILLLLGFYTNYKLAEKNRYLLMFILGYTIAAFAFLTKGVPALYFQAVSIIATGFVFKSYRKIFSFYHLVGILCFILITGAYFWLYSFKNDPLLYLRQLFIGEPTLQLDITFSQRLSYIFSFAGRSIIAYSPIFLLIPLILLKKNLYFLVKDRFNLYSLFIIFFICLSFVFGNFQPHYILCISPFVVILIVKFIHLFPSLSLKQKSYIFSFTTLAILLEIILHRKLFDYFSISYKIYAFLSILIFFMLLMILVFSKKFIPVFLCFMFIFIVLRFTYLNPAVSSFYPKEYNTVKKDAERIIGNVDKSGLKIFPKDVEINHATIFYLTHYYKKIIYTTNECIDTSCFYLTTADKLPKDLTVFDSLGQRYQFRPGEYNKIHAVNNQLFLFKPISVN